MKIFDLPKTTEFGKVVPKNAFDKFTNSKQKKAMSELIKRITWQHKISTATTNLPSKEIKEIQVFLVELKRKNDLTSILTIINRAIPYHIIFVLKCEDEILISTSAKHLHPHKKDEAVIDCTFNTNWLKIAENSIHLMLSQTLDWTYMDFCSQISERKQVYKTYSEFVAKILEVKALEAKIYHVERQMKREPQFNKKVELNIELSKLRQILRKNG